MQGVASLETCNPKGSPREGGQGRPLQPRAKYGLHKFDLGSAKAEKVLCFVSSLILPHATRDEIPKPEACAISLPFSVRLLWKNEDSDPKPCVEMYSCYHRCPQPPPPVPPLPSPATPRLVLSTLSKASPHLALYTGTLEPANILHPRTLNPKPPTHFTASGLRLGIQDMKLLAWCVTSFHQRSPHLSSSESASEDKRRAVADLR